jgi:HAD superfamily hydrolase (TIGR01490 family)
MSAMDLDIRPGVKQAAFFDLERTLTRDATEQVVALAMARRGRLPWSSLARVLWIYLKYDLHLLTDFEAMKRSGARVFTGRDHAEDLTLLADLFASRLRAAIYPEAAALVQRMLAAGFFVAIVSSTYRFMVEPYARHLGAGAWFGCDLELDGAGRCTGAITGTIYHQERKGQAVDELARQHGLALAHSYAFGDSPNDVPMLERVGHPVLVNPGGKLGRLAADRGWTVARWASPQALRATAAT